MRVAWLALLQAAIIAASYSSMLTFVSPPGRRVLLGLPPRIDWSYTRVVNRYSGGWTTTSSHQGLRRDGPPDPLVPREASPQQRRALLSVPIDRGLSFLRSRGELYRRANISKMEAKGVDATSSTSAADNRPPLVGVRTGGNGASTSASAASAPANDAEISVGSRIRLRDTGRLGTVVGKKAGGWWIVELLQSWGGNIGASGGSGRGVSGAAAERTKAAPEAPGGTTRNATTVAAGGGPISTRKANMEPLGDAYASWSSEERPSLVDATPPQQAVARRRLSTASTISSRKGTKSASQKRARVEERASTPTAAVRGEAGEEVSAVEAPMKAQVAGRDMPTTGEETVAIHAMSAEGLAHADMTEWLIFSDLHVSPTSLDVSLEVSVGIPRQPHGSTELLAVFARTLSLLYWRHLPRNGKRLAIVQSNADVLYTSKSVSRVSGFLVCCGDYCF